MLIKVLIGALLVATTTVAQTTTQSTNKAGTAERPSGSTESTTRSKAKASKGPVRPLPQPSLKEKLESGDRAIPSYKKEKDAGMQKVSNRYSPRRTASGARKDTLIERKKKQ